MLKHDATTVGIRRPFAPVAEVAIADAERRMGRPIPAPYRAFLLAHNGGFPDPDGFVVSDDGGARDEQRQIKHFFGVNTGKRVTDIVSRFEMHRGRVPDALLPIATDMGGNLISLATAGPAVGAVYLWDHETTPDGGMPPYGRAIRLAPTLEVFLAGLADIAA